MTFKLNSAKPAVTKVIEPAKQATVTLELTPMEVAALRLWAGRSWETSGCALFYKSKESCQLLGIKYLCLDGRTVGTRAAIDIERTPDEQQWVFDMFVKPAGYTK